jgi:hypothetical protein
MKPFFLYKLLAVSSLEVSSLDAELAESAPKSSAKHNLTVSSWLLAIISTSYQTNHCRQRQDAPSTETTGLQSGKANTPTKLQAKAKEGYEPLK